MGARLTNISNFRAFTGLEYVTIKYNSLTSFPVNEMISPSFIGLDLTSNLFTSIDVSSLVNLENLELCNNQLTTIYLSSLVNLIRLELCYNQFTTIDISNLVNLQFLNLSGNQFTTIDISGLVNLERVTLTNNQLTETCVNDILIQLDNNGLSSLYYSCNLTGGTNAAPTGAGIIAKNNLIAKSWTVNTN